MPPRKAAPTCQRTAHFCVNSVRMFLRFTLRGSSASTVNSSNIIILFSIISLSKDYHYYYHHHHHHHQHNNIGTYDLKKTEHLRMHTLRCQIISQAVQLLYSLLPRVNEDVKSLFFFFSKTMLHSWRCLFLESIDTTTTILEELSSPLPGRQTVTCCQSC